MRKTRFEELSKLYLRSAKRLWYDEKKDITAYEYIWHFNNVEYIFVEGNKFIDALELLRIKFKNDRKYLNYIKKLVEVK